MIRREMLLSAVLTGAALGLLGRCSPDQQDLPVVNLPVDEPRQSAEEYARPDWSFCTVDPNGAPCARYILGKGYRIDLRDPNGLTGDSVRRLCESGLVCRTIGHSWGQFSAVPGLPYAPGDSPACKGNSYGRKCQVCGTVSIRTKAEWDVFSKRETPTIDELLNHQDKAKEWVP
jgi:hypothetical protein